jgi:type 1 glutamine amidotransferase
MSPRVSRVSLAAFVIAIVLAMSACSGDDSSSPTAPTPPTNPPPSAPRARVIVVTHTEGFRHSSIAIAETTIAQLGAQNNLFDVTFCRTADDVRRMLTTDGLRDVQAVFFANTTGNLGIPDMAAFLAWIADGHAFLGTHSASDTYHDDPRYLDMLGNEFLTHGNQAEVNAVIENAAHPAVAPLGARFRVLDEIYRFVSNNRGRVDILLSLDRTPADGLPDANQPGDLPLAWSRSYGAGRVFYTALGHREEVWQDPRYRQHLLGALRWSLNR